jgi:hypothetical protein
MKLRLGPSGPFSNVAVTTTTPFPTPIVVVGVPFTLLATQKIDLLTTNFITLVYQATTDSGPMGGTLELRVIRISPAGGVEQVVSSQTISPGLQQLALIGFPPLLAAPLGPNFGPGIYEVRLYAQSLDPMPVTLNQLVEGMVDGN